MTKLMEKIKEVLAQIKELALSLPGVINTALPRLLALKNGLREKLDTGYFLSEKKRPLLIGLGGMIAILMVLLIVITASRDRGGRADDSPAAIPVGFTISVEDLFFPSEPEFFPEFILEREPRSSWSIEDLRPHWRSPADIEIWRNQLRSSVDRLLEGVQ